MEWGFAILWYYGGSLKNPILMGGGFTKNQYIGGDCLKREAWTICRFKRRLSKKEGNGGF